MKMPNGTAPNPIIAELRQSPFFIIAGPKGRRLVCQWTGWNTKTEHAAGIEFEIICPETPEAMGSLFGTFYGGVFRMRPAVRVVSANGLSTHLSLAPELDLDQEWRGSISHILDLGHDLEMRPDGLLYIADPEEPAADPDSGRDLSLAA